MMPLNLRLVVLLAGMSLLAVGLAAAAPLQLFVAPAGNDAWNGLAPEKKGVDGPFATLQRAQQEIRQRKVAGGLTTPVSVYVRGGVYWLPETLTLTAEDSGTPECPVTFKPFKTEQPQLLGARRITGWKPWKGQIMQADLKGGPLEKTVFRQLFFKGARQVMARYPNLDPKDPHGGGWAHVRAVDGDSVKDHFTYTDDVEKSWTKVQYAEVGIHPYFDWAWNVLGVKSVNREEKVLALKGNVSYDLHIGDRYFVQNLLEELDSPGEWYLDRDTATVYFWPPAPLKDGDAYAAVMGTVVKLDGARNVALRGFTLEACDGDAVVVSNCEDTQVAACTVRNCGSWGIRITGGHRSGAAGNDVYATGAGGIFLDGGNRQTLERGDNYASNNYIHHIAQFAKTYNTGINVGGVGNRADHNLIHDTYHAGATINGNENVFEYNVVHHTNLGSADTGGIYYCSRDFTMRGNKIQFNIFHHCGGFGKDNSWAPVQGGKVTFSYPHFTWGIYLDDPTSGTLVYGNILWDVPMCGLHNHGGRDNLWENNIVVDTPAVNAGMLWDGWEEYPPIIRKLQAVQTPGSPYLKQYPELATYDTAHPSGMTGVKFLRNIFYYTTEGSRWLREKQAVGWQGGQLLYSYSTDEVGFKGSLFDYNLVSPPPGVAMKISLNRRPDPGRLLNWADWQATGMDAHSVVGDPLFVDPAKRDYRLKPDSPALKLGFKQIPAEKIGPFKDDLRASWPIVEAPGASQLGTFTTTREFKVPGYEQRPAVEFVPRGGAPNFFAKLAAKQPVRVAYYGGGIHDAGGWRGQVLQWLRQQNPGVQVDEIDASICDCVRGSGFSVYRFAHDVLQRNPDLVFVDFASEDSQANADDIWAAVEAVVRQARQAKPDLDVIFLYAFRPPYEEAYAQGLAPSPVSAYEALADRYAIPGINMGYRIAQLARDGKLVLKGAAPAGGLSFSGDGVRPGKDGNAVYATVITEALAKLAANATPTTRGLPQPLFRRNLERAKLVAITPDMVSGDWQRLTTAEIAGRNFARHFDELWIAKAAGAKLTFRFRGTAASLFDLMGPTTGRIRVTVDGQDRGTRQQVDPWSYYYRLASMEIASGLEDKEHTVVVELLSDVPDRSVPIAEAKKVNRFNEQDFQGVALHLGWIRLIGELVK